MGIPESPSARGACPTDEELAAFLDGMLPAEERARITAHLADCESCYEIFAGAVHFQQDEQDSDGDEEQVGAQKGRVVPFPVKKESDTRSRKSWWAAVAAAVLVLGGGLTAYRLLFPSEQKLELADLKARPIPAKDFYVPVHYRGGDDRLDSFADPSARFMVGVLVMDVRLAREQGNIDAGHLIELAMKLKKADFPDAEAKALQDNAEKLRSGNPKVKEELAKSLPAQEAAIEDFLDGSSYRFGKWTEAGRLAAVTKTPAFFSRWSNKRFFAALLKDPLSKDEGVVEPLAEIKAIMDRGVHQADFDPLAKNFKEIIRHYDI